MITIIIIIISYWWLPATILAVYLLSKYDKANLSVQLIWWTHAAVPWLSTFILLSAMVSV